MRTDVLIKNKSFIKVIEVKATTEPKKEHMYDLSYQHFILLKNYTLLEKWNFYLMTINRNFVLLKNNIEFQILDFFQITDFYYNSNPIYDDLGFPKSKSLNLIEGILTLENNFDFDYIFDKIVEIQQNDLMPEEKISDNLNLFGKNELLQFFKQLEGIDAENSLFNFRSDSGSSLKKKLYLYYEDNLNYIHEVADKELVSKKISPKDIPPKNSSDRYQYLRMNKLWRLLQKDVTSKDIHFVDKSLIKEHLKKYKTPIYMFDFEAVNLAQPRIKYSSPYEQVPYQYSIHIIHDIDNFDYETLKGITHLEYLPHDNRNFYEELFKNLTNDLTKFGFGTYVAFNKTFEQMVIKNALKPYKKLSNDIVDKLSKINENIIDLMIPFRDMYYYHPTQKGSYSIKAIAPLFSNLNYKDLNEIVQKGDQSASQAKNWLIDNIQDSTNRWLSIREDMLKYCKYDTLSMVAIFQSLIEINNSKK